MSKVSNIQIIELNEQIIKIQNEIKLLKKCLKRKVPSNNEQVVLESNHPVYQDTDEETNMDNLVFTPINKFSVSYSNFIDLNNFFKPPLDISHKPNEIKPYHLYLLFNMYKLYKTNYKNLSVENPINQKQRDINQKYNLLKNDMYTQWNTNEIIRDIWIKEITIINNNSNSLTKMSIPKHKLTLYQLFTKYYWDINLLINKLIKSNMINIEHIKVTKFSFTAYLWVYFNNSYVKNDWNKLLNQYNNFIENKNTKN